MPGTEHRRHHEVTAPALLLRERLAVLFAGPPSVQPIALVQMCSCFPANNSLSCSGKVIRLWSPGCSWYDCLTDLTHHCALGKQKHGVAVRR